MKFEEHCTNKLMAITILLNESDYMSRQLSRVSAGVVK